MLNALLANRAAQDSCTAIFSWPSNEWRYSSVEHDAPYGGAFTRCQVQYLSVN
jgi:hypothetical protein